MKVDFLSSFFEDSKSLPEPNMNLLIHSAFPLGFPRKIDIFCFY